MFKNTKKQGDWGLGEAIAYFTKSGYTVCLPLTDSQDYDLIVDNGLIKRVQVKTCTFKRRGRYEVSLTVKGGNRTATGKIKVFDSKSVDFVFVVTPDGSYLLPSDLLGKSGVALGVKYETYKLKYSAMV